MLKNNLKLNAIAWKAKSASQSYGVFSVSLSEKDKEQIFMEYEQMLENRKEEENMRLEQARLKQAEQKAKKKKLKR